VAFRPLAACLAVNLGLVPVELSATYCQAPVATLDPARAVSQAQLDASPQEEESGSAARFPVAERSAEQSSLEVVADLGRVCLERQVDLDRVRQEVLVGPDQDRLGVLRSGAKDDDREGQTRHAGRCSTKY
jgi:hypothetical protein